MTDSPLPPVGERAIGIGRDNLGAAVTGNKNRVKVEVHHHYGAQTGVPQGPVFAVPPLDGSEIPRPDVMRPLRDRVLAACAPATPTAPDRGAQSTVAITTALRGAGGFGKTTVARMLVHDPHVRAAFADGIVWVTLGEDVAGSALAARVNDVTAALTGTPPPQADPMLAGAALGEALGERRLLLVVDDAWSRHQLDPFLTGGPNTVRLITTRQRDTLPHGCIAVDVDAMADTDAHALLLGGLSSSTRAPGDTAADDVSTHLSRALLDATGRWPVLLSLVNGAARADVDAGRSRAETLEEILSALQTSGPAVLDVTDPARRHAAVSTTVAASMNRLTADQRDRYLELAVFGEDVQIPRPVLERYWAHTGGWPAFQTHRFCQQLGNLALVAAYRQDPPDGPRLLLHDVIRAHLRTLVGAPGLADLDARILDAHRPLVSRPANTPEAADTIDGTARGSDGQRGASAWGLLDRAERYLWEWIPAHLSGAGGILELGALMQDPRWLIGVLESLGPAVLEVQLALTADDPTCARLGTVIRQNAHLLSPLDPPGSLAATLASRFPSDQSLAPIERGLDNLAGSVRLAMPGPGPDLAHPALQRTLTGRTGLIPALAIGPDGAWLATGGGDGTVRIWDPSTGTERLALAGHRGGVSGLAVAFDGTWLATAGHDRSVRVWDPATGAELHTLTVDASSRTGLVVAPDSRWFVTSSKDRIVRIWDPLTGTERHTLTGHSSRVTAVAVSPDGTWLATTSRDQTVRIWDTGSGAERRVLTGHDCWLDGVVIAPDGTWLATTGTDGTVRIWDPATGIERHRLPGHSGGTSRIAVAPDGTWLATTGTDRQVRIWDPATGIEQRSLVAASPVTALAVAPDGRWLATTSRDGTVRIWDLTMDGASRPMIGHAGPVTCLALAKDSNWLATASDDGTVRTWDVASGNQRHSVTADTGTVSTVAIAPSGAWLATASSRAVRIWNTTLSSELHTLTSETGWISAVSIAPDGTWLAAASASTVCIWDPTTGSELHSLDGHTSGLTDIAIAPDGTWLATASNDYTARIWDPVTGTERHRLIGHRHRLYAVAIAPDGTWLATTSRDQTVRIWDSATGRERHVLTGHSGGVLAVTIASDGTWLATASSDKTVRIWDPQGGTERHILSGHTDIVSAVTIAPDSSWLATASLDRTVRVWDPHGRPLASLRVESELRCIASTHGLLAVAGERGPYLVRLAGIADRQQRFLETETRKAASDHSPADQHGHRP